MPTRGRHLPTATAPLHYLPQPRNPNFCGRQHVLESLHKALTGGGKGRIHAICGSGGVGKTQLAIEYAYGHIDDYSIVWWLPASEPNTLASFFLSLAEHLGVIAPGQNDAQQARQAVCDALQDRNDWLLIFDDAPDAEAIKPYIPETGGHVLITSRNDRWDSLGKSFCLRVLERADAVDFLMRRSGRTFEPSAFTLCKALDDLPLAIEQAGAVIASAGITFADYLKRFEDHWAELLRSGRPAGEYPDCVAMTWELACRELESIDPELADFLNVLGYLAPAEISRSMITRGAAILPPPLSDRLAYLGSLDEAIYRLNQFSLIGANENAVTVHRLISALTRDRLPDGQRGRWCRLALEMMAKAFSFHEDSPGSWSECAEALPHALAASEHAIETAIDPAVNAKLLNNVGEYLNQIGQYEQARTILKRALRLNDEAHGSENVRRSAIINNLGRVLTRLGNYTDARGHFESALKLDQAAYGDSHPHVAEVANNYGTLLHQTGDFRSALQNFEWALEICRNTYGSEHSKVASITNNIAYALANMGEVDRAIEYFTQAISAAEAGVGAEHPIVATMRTNLGIVLRLKGDADAARIELERAAVIGQSSLGPNHLEVARSFANLGALAFEQADFQLARQYFQRSLDIVERAMGPNHVLLCDRLNDMGRCMKASGDIDASAAYFDRSTQIRRDSSADADVNATVPQEV
jgi:tetratricopeptide (TPR) repeat protein